VILKANHTKWPSHDLIHLCFKIFVQLVGNCSKALLYLEWKITTCSNGTYWFKIGNSVDKEIQQNNFSKEEKQVSHYPIKLNLKNAFVLD
jgi:hypothetical protein